MTGQTLGNYKILMQAGEGSMGAVHHAIDLMLDREVALKALRPELTSRSDVVERFREEARVQARLNHPNIAQLYTLFPHGNDLFMVMEFVKGPTLDSIIRQFGRLTLNQALPLFLQVLDGVEHAHRMGIIHRDLKPANIMLNQDGLVKVTDFGIARVLGSARMTREGVMIGTIEYMSPEGILGHEMDARSDLYSLGLVLFEMLSGNPPFAGRTEYELMLAQMETPTPPIRGHVPDVPPEIEAAILKATAKDPNDRYSSVGEFAAVLRKFSGEMPAVSFFTLTLGQGAFSAEARSASGAPVAETRLSALSSSRGLLASTPSAAGQITWQAAWIRSLESRFKSYIFGILGLAALVVVILIAAAPTKKAVNAVSPDTVPAGVGDNAEMKEPDSVQPARKIVPQQSAQPALIAKGTNTGKEVHKVEVPPFAPPVITQFNAERRSVAPGETTHLMWILSGEVSKIAITPGPPINVGNNNLEIAPEKTTEYTLDITGPAGTASKSVTIEVADRSEPKAPAPTSSALLVGNSDAEATQTYADAQTARNHKRWADAAALYGKAARLKPGWREPLVERAQLDVKLAHFADAIEDSNEALRLDPNDAVTLYMRGCARLAQNDIPGAISDFTDAIRVKPDYADAYVQRGNAKRAAGDHEGEKVDFDTAHSLQKKR